MTETKTCNYRRCKNIFYRPESTPDGNWKQQSRCLVCREKANRMRKNIDNKRATLGRYEVKNETIDRFLFGK